MSLRNGGKKNVILAAGVVAGATIMGVILLLQGASAVAETREGTFIVKCPPTHVAQVDPIVNPGPAGTLSGHLHQFFANRSTASDSTLASMRAATTSCPVRGDTAGYWEPTLHRPDGSIITPVTMFAYYKNKPVSYGTTQAFPPDFRMIAGGAIAPSRVFWDCFNGGGNFNYPPKCAAGDFTVSRIQFPNCWDGVRLDSSDHRSHVVYPVSNACPAAFPVKLPFVNFFIRYPPNTLGEAWKLSDGTTLPHADFWQTWDQPRLEHFVDTCLKAGVNCAQIKD